MGDTKRNIGGRRIRRTTTQCDRLKRDGLFDPPSTQNTEQSSGVEDVTLREQALATKPKDAFGDG